MNRRQTRSRNSVVATKCVLVSFTRVIAGVGVAIFVIICSSFVVDIENLLSGFSIISISGGIGNNGDGLFTASAPPPTTRNFWIFLDFSFGDDILDFAGLPRWDLTASILCFWKSNSILFGNANIPKLHPLETFWKS